MHEVEVDTIHASLARDDFWQPVVEVEKSPHNAAPGDVNLELRIPALLPVALRRH
jgi:hypothetical protein